MGRAARAVRAGELRHRPHARRDGSRVRARVAEDAARCAASPATSDARAAPDVRARMRGALAPPRSRCAARRGVRRATARACPTTPSAAVGARAHAAVDHRPAPGRRPADAQRRRHDLDLLQRRGLRLAGRRARARGDAACASPRGATPSSSCAATRRGASRALLPRLRGMFAFAIVDFRTKRVHVVRDRLGLKPIVYAHDDERLRVRVDACAACCRGCRATSARFPPEAIDAYLAHRYIPAPRTIFANIARLPNAHRLELRSRDRTRLAVHRYWSPQPAPVGRLRARCSTKRSSCASSPIVRSACSCRAASTRARSRAGSPPRGIAELRSFSAAFPGLGARRKRGGGGDRARRSACRTSASWCRPRSATTSREIVATLDEPFADPSSFPTWYLARDTERHVKVVLGGDGGDELFARLQARRQALAQRLARRVARAAARAARRASEGLAQGDGRARASTGNPRTRCASRASRPTSGASCSRRARRCPSHYWRAPDLDAATRAATGCCAGTSRTIFPSTCCARPTSRTMAHGLELRAPLLDHRFVEAVLALPPRATLHDAAEALPRDASRRARRASARSRARSAASIRRCDGWLKDDLRERIARRRGLARARSRGGQIDGARAQAMIDAYANTPSLAEQVLSLVILEESLRQLAALRARWRVAARRCVIASVALALARWGWRRRRPADAAAHPRAAPSAARRHADAHRAAREAARAVSAARDRDDGRRRRSRRCTRAARTACVAHAVRSARLRDAFARCCALPRFDLAILPADNRWSWLARAFGASRGSSGSPAIVPRTRTGRSTSSCRIRRCPRRFARPRRSSSTGPRAAPYRTGAWPAPARTTKRRVRTSATRCCTSARRRRSSCGPRSAGARWPTRSRRDGLAVVWSAGPGEARDPRRHRSASTAARADCRHAVAGRAVARARARAAARVSRHRHRAPRPRRRRADRHAVRSRLGGDLRSRRVLRGHAGPRGDRRSVSVPRPDDPVLPRSRVGAALRAPATAMARRPLSARAVHGGDRRCAARRWPAVARALRR